MDSPTWYALCLAAVLVILVLGRLSIFLITLLRAYGLVYLLRHVFYPTLFKRRDGSGSISRLQATLITLYLVANGVSMSIGVHTLKDLQYRAGAVACANLIPLFFGGRMNFWLDSLGCSLHAYYLMHRWAGRVLVLEGLLHASLAIASMSWEHSKEQTSGVVAVSALTLLLITSLFFIRRRFYEAFLHLHFLLAIIVASALFIHLMQNRRYWLYVVTAMSTWAFNFALRTIRWMYYNVGGRNMPESWYPDRVRISDFVDPLDNTITAAQVTLVLRRRWKASAGQFAYLCFPTISPLGFLQCHPCSIVWWDKLPTGESTISFIVQPRRGFSQSLIRRRSARAVLLDGPYGNEYQFGRHETVLMFAGGIGIAGILPYARQLIEGHNRRRLLVRRLSLVWVLDKECHQEWVRNWMDKILEMDAYYILNIHLYVPQNWQNASARPGKIEHRGEHERLYKLYEQPKIFSLVSSETRAEAGSTAIAVCGPPKLATEVREAVVANLEKDVTFVELDFRPDEA